MLEYVFLVEEMFDTTSNIYQTLAICESRKIAENWIACSGGNPTIQLANGDIAQKYRISKFSVISQYYK